MFDPRRAVAPLVFLAPLAAAVQERHAVYDAPLVVLNDQHRFERILDLDADGDMDAVGWWWQSTSQDGVTVTGWINPGNGDLQEAWTKEYAPEFNWPLKHETVVADLNDDARQDFVMGIGRDLVPYSSNGASTPTQWPDLRIPNGENVWELAATDLNGDGRDDLVVGTGTSLRVAMNQGPGQAFTWSSSVLLGEPVRSLAIGELTGDGVDDDILISVGNEVRWYIAAGGQLTFRYSFVDDVPGAPILLCGDVTGDGAVDVTLFSETGEQQIWRRTGPSTFTLEPATTGGPATDLADVNGDGVLDGVCCGGGSSVEAHNDDPSAFQIAINDGTGQFGNSFDFMIPNLGAEHIAGAADIDGDGDVDLVAGRTIYYARGPLEQKPRETFDAWQHHRGVADVNGDGFPDLEIGIGQGLLNRGDGSFAEVPSEHEPAPGQGQFEGPGFPGDWDGDGDVDLIVRHFEGGTLLAMRLLRNDGLGWFEDGGPAGAPGVDFNVGTQHVNEAWTSLAEDVDSDGDLDLIVNRLDEAVHTTQLATALWINDGTGFFTAGASWDNEIVKGVALLNADTFPDLIVVHEWNGRMQYRLSRGDGTYNGAVTIDNDLFLDPDRRVLVHDFDRDGDMDVAAPSHGAWVGLFLNDGDAGFTRINPFFDPMDPLANPGGLAVFGGLHLVATDFDGDGWMDLIASPLQHAPNASFVARNRPDQPSFFTPRVQVLQASAVTDLDGDGDEDLLSDVVHLNPRLDPELGDRFCVSLPNSTGEAARIHGRGSASVADNDVRLLAWPVPVNQPGIFYYGPNGIELPFGNGLRCVGGGDIGTFRLPPRTSNGAGVLSYTLDLSVPPAPEGSITPGSVWKFQAWFRDPQAGGANFDLSDGLSITFLP